MDPPGILGEYAQEVDVLTMEVFTGWSSYIRVQMSFTGGGGIDSLPVQRFLASLAPELLIALMGAPPSCSASNHVRLLPNSQSCSDGACICLLGE